MANTVGLPLSGLVVGVVVGILGYMTYNIFFHPLRKYPGPLSHRMTLLPWLSSLVRGELPQRVVELHKQYGPVVRIAPGELAFCNAQAWRDIYGHKKGGEEEFPKYDGFYHPVESAPRSLINAGRADHGILRRHLSHGFSERSMRAQEPIIGSYVDLLITRLQDEVKKQKGEASHNMREWYNWTTFDIIGDLSFGTEGGFGCLEKAEYHPWVQTIMDMIPQTALVLGGYRLGLEPVINLVSRLYGFAEDRHRAVASKSVRQRMDSGKERPDFLEGLVREREKLQLTESHLTATAALLVFAGSETTASLLTGATYLLTAHPEILKRLEHEVRSTFRNEEEITLTSVGSLSYMLACLNEALRVYTPVPLGLPRVAPKGGDMVDGHFVPEGTIVSVHQWAVNHDERFWTEPYKYAPERWVGDAKYKDDQLDVMQSFSVGPRNCIGRNLAYAEMRLILARIVYNFDMSLAEESKGWMDGQKAYSLWDKPPLHIHLKPAAR